MWKYELCEAIMYISSPTLKQVQLKTKLNFLKITDGGWGVGGNLKQRVIGDWNKIQTTRGEMSDKTKTAFQPVVVSKSSKSLQLPDFA